MIYLPAGSTPPPIPTGDVVIDSNTLLEGEGYGEGWAVPAADEESDVQRGEFENLWPLQLVDLKDMDMVGTLFRLLRRLPQVIITLLQHVSRVLTCRMSLSVRPLKQPSVDFITIHCNDMQMIMIMIMIMVPSWCMIHVQVIDHYLDMLIFPDTMEHRGLKLAANGQDVGGDMLFEVKLGFSGTPSDLLPLELGRSVTNYGHLSSG